jgi:hypothetical protein
MTEPEEMGGEPACLLPSVCAGCGRVVGDSGMRACSDPAPTGCSQIEAAAAV